MHSGSGAEGGDRTEVVVKLRDYLVNPLPHNKSIDLSTSKLCTEEKLNVAHLMPYVSYWYNVTEIMLTLSQTSPGFYVSAVQVFENNVGKGEVAHNEQFLLFPQYFISV